MTHNLSVAIVHYHVRPGGVTRVIETACRALAALGVRTVVLAGEPSSAPLPSPLRVVPGLAYDATTSPDQLAQDLRAAAADALGRAPDLWHIHNHSLGKNIVLTAVVDSFARANERLLLQVHDFAEDLRPQQAAALASLPPSVRIYPDANHVHYALLTRRDANRMKAARLAPERAWLLPNAVTAGISPASEIPSDGTILYPTRAIRRKNLGEFLLWSVLLEGARFESTLAPTSAADIPAYDRWQTLVRELRQPVELGVGLRTDRSFRATIGACRTAMTTSVAEGFGFAFLEPWLMGRPVCGRDLPDITCDFREAGVALPGLYSSLPIPQDWIDPALLRDACRRSADLLARDHADHGITADELHASMTRGGVLDFGRLDEAMQEIVIRRAAGDPAARAGLLQSFPTLESPKSTQLLDDNARAIRTAFSPDRYGEHLLRIYTAVAGSRPGSVGALDGRAIADSFLQADRISLLRT